MGNIKNTKDLNTDILRKFVIAGIEAAVSTLIRRCILEYRVYEDHIHPVLHFSLRKKTFLKYIKEDLVVNGYVIGLESLLNIEIIDILKDILISNDMSYILSSCVKEDFYSLYKLFYTENDDKDIIDINNVYLFNIAKMSENVIEMLNKYQVELNGIKYGIVFSITSNGNEKDDED